MIPIHAAKLFLALATATPASQPGGVSRPKGPEETVIVTAHATPVAFTSVSRRVTVLTREMIRRLPVRSVDDLLRLAGVDVRSRGAFGLQSDLSLRGAGFGQVLVLVDGIRLNDAQTGHHNADFPFSLDDIERIEVLHGPSSALHGADAFGGTVQIVTRRDRPRLEAMAAGGSYGLAEARVAGGWENGRFRQQLSAWGNRSSGFMFARDFQTAGFRSQSLVGDATRITVGHVDKEFGANGFYGPSPSREWTKQTLAAVDHRTRLGADLELQTRGWYRTHGDHFLWDVRRPGFAENRHRTHAVGVQATLHRQLAEATRLSLGAEAGGDWIRSSNLGDHDINRAQLFAEFLREFPAGSVALGLRWDRYSRFGSSISPGLSAGWWVMPSLRFRGSAAHAFRVPAFTELYYRDPNHRANADLKPETAWEGEIGADWFPGADWQVEVGGFLRSDRNLIDWVRQSPAERWQTRNIRRLWTHGIELSLQRLFEGGWLVRTEYQWMVSTTRDLTLLSKYVLDFPRHGWLAMAAAPLGGGFEAGPVVRYRRRSDGRDYWVLDCRANRRFGDLMLFVEGTNLTGTEYQEIRGVDMPGRWWRAGMEYVLP
jgi:iron complex outermembrane receptor protein